MVQSGKKTLVLGASPKVARYSYLAVERLRNAGCPVIAVGKRRGTIADISIQEHLPDENDIDTVTLYLNPQNQEGYIDYLLQLKPRRIIFNPGTENRKLALMAKDAGIQVVEACTLVLLSTGQY